MLNNLLFLIIYYSFIKDFFRRVYSDESAQSYLDNHCKWKEELYANRVKEILETTNSKRELLLQATNVEIKPFYIHNTEKGEETMDSPKRTDKKQYRDRISNMDSELSKGDNIPAVFTNLGVVVVVNQTTELPQISNRKKLSSMLSQPDSHVHTQNDDEVARRKEEYRTIAVKKERPKHYGKFEIENEIPRSLLIDFGVPPSLNKSNPMTLALQKQRSRDKFIAQRQVAEKPSQRSRDLGDFSHRSRDFSQRSRDFSQPPTERNSVVDFSSIVRDRNRAFSVGLNPLNEIESSRKKEIHEILAPIERDPVRTITHTPIIATDRSGKQEDYHQEKKSEFERSANSTLDSQIKDLMKDNILFNIKKAFMLDKLQAKHLDEWIEHSRRQTKTSFSTEISKNQKGLNIGKKQPYQVMVKDPQPFQNLSSFAKSRLDKRLMDDDSDINKSQSAFLYQPLITQREIISHPRASNSKLMTEALEPIKSYHTQEREKSSRVRPEVPRLNLAGQSLGITSGLKPKFRSHALKVNEFNKEVAQVKSLLNTKRFGVQ